MKQFSNYNNVKPQTGGGIFTQLPKDGYVIKIISVKETKSKKGAPMIALAFDIAEGPYKDYYRRQFEASTREDKHWSYDAVYNIMVPDDNSPEWMQERLRTFTYCLEESNPNYHWDWDEKKWKGKLVGVLMRIEQNADGEGKIYDHTKVGYFATAGDVRSGKFNLPKDKLLAVADPANARADNITDNGDFMQIPDGVDEEVPF